MLLVIEKLVVVVIIYDFKVNRALCLLRGCVVVVRGLFAVFGRIVGRLGVEEKFRT